MTYLNKIHTHVMLVAWKAAREKHKKEDLCSDDIIRNILQESARPQPRRMEEGTNGVKMETQPPARP
jgi:hypothetical protein